MTARIDRVAGEIAERSALGLVHAGAPTDPSVRYLLAAASASDRPDIGFADEEPATVGIRGLSAGSAGWDGRERRPWAVAVVDGRVFVEAPDGEGHPSERLVARLADAHATEDADRPVVLAPSSIPHDAALYVERGGFELASTDAIDRARNRKTAPERARIEAAQAAAGAGYRRAGAVLARADDVDGRLVADGTALTPARLRRAVDAAVVEAGGFPAAATVVETDTDPAAGLRVGESVVLRLAPREPAGYRGALTRTLVPGTDGGWERRAHVAVESALRSAKTMLAADAATVREVEAELVAEVGSFGFAREATATVAGVGLEPSERPARGSSEIPDGAVVAIAAEVRSPDGESVALGDLLTVDADGAEWVTRPSRALAPAALVA